jgi:hypothetical protein
MTIKALQNQSLLDIAIQEFGSAEAAFDIALLNDLSITDELTAGQVLEIPFFEKMEFANRPIADYYKNRGLKPATALSENADENGIFDDTFDETFE